VNPFQYAVLRAVPRIDRGELINIGVVLYCQATDFLSATVEVDRARLAALSADLDPDVVSAAGDAVVRACAEPVGSARRNDGLATRFGMLVAPRSTVVQPGPVHAGVTADPERTLDHLMTRLVR
jgi:hypothetical protein